jgi:CPA1 family monovalent cation:H+ antiporter
MHIFDIIAILILLSGLFLFINTYFLKMPSSIGLMILALILSGMVMFFGNFFPEYHLAEHVKEYDFADILYRFVLSVMLFAGALNVDFKKLGSQLLPVLVLAFFGVLISTFVVATGIYYLLDWMNIPLSYTGCLVFGALISSTDPVAITKTIRRFNLSKQMESKISGEALLNGGIAMVIAMVLVRVNEYEMANGNLDTVDTIMLVVRNIGGGLLAGLIIGWVGFKLVEFIENDSVEVEVLITMALVMGGSYIGNLLNISPMLIAVVTGLMLTNYKHKEGEEPALGKYAFRFWGLMQDMIAAMLFVLIGFEMLVLDHRMDYFAAGFFAIVIVLFARWISVFIPIKLMSKSISFDSGTVSVLSWGALRGGLPIALSLSLVNFPNKEIIITMTYVVVVCSVLYQGLSLTSMMKVYRAKHIHDH